MLRDHNGIVVRVFSKLVGEGLAIRAEILALLEDLLQTRTLDLSNLQVEGGSAILLTQVAELERGPWRYPYFVEEVFPPLLLIMYYKWYGGVITGLGVHGVVTTGSGVHDGMITGLGAYGGMITGLGAHDGVITGSIWEYGKCFQVAFQVCKLVEEMERAVGDLRSYNRKDGIQVDFCCLSKFAPFCCFILVLKCIALSLFTLGFEEMRYWDPQKKDYFLCAETPGAARAWVSTLHATQLVLKAHKEAVNSLSGNGSAKLGTVATVVAAANSTALECSKEIEAAMQISMRNALGVMMNKTSDGPMDDLTIMKACCYLETRL
ncbi:hypothetical protein CK203_097677 [Vitis vinifera]|uniref:Uncharacterized protein n=1 Tax=Vitis vinifera TaxID=29760 RepID=A0A438D6U6_VITVI|nr:hypothetical protein CK203_097677 [Vitis vinifera]